MSYRPGSDGVSPVAPFWHAPSPRCPLTALPALLNQLNQADSAELVGERGISSGLLQGANDHCARTLTDVADKPGRFDTSPRPSSGKHNRWFGFITRYVQKEK
jgi:hypothetical protein